MSLFKLQKLRIALKAYEANLVDESCKLITEAVANSQTNYVGPIPLPTKRRIYCVLRSPHVNKDSREHFEMRVHKRIIDIPFPSELTMENLRKLDIAAGVNIEIKSF
jgi:small subunit ribosomal protein S10